MVPSEHWKILLWNYCLFFYVELIIIYKNSAMAHY